MKKLSSILYKISRNIGKSSTVINDVETLLTFNPKKIYKRMVRKQVNKTGYKITKKINRKFK